MASVEETRREIEATRTELDTTLGLLEQRVHYELDWKARIRRNKTRLMIGGAGLAVLVIAGVAGTKVVNGRRHRGIEEQLRDLTHFDDVRREVVRLREQLAGAPAEDNDPLWQKVALKATTALGAAAGTMLTRSLVTRFDVAEPDDYDPKHSADHAASRVG